ncbi:MAG: hypothetical protein ABIT36_00185 [Steroidobacteraceae bacterium]
MNRNRLIALPIVLAGLASTQAFAVGQLAEVSITDRDTGKRLTAHFHRGEYWVAGRPGARYGINIRSRDERRLLAVTSVDGVNVVTGETARSDQRGYVFAPRDGYDITGWRKSDSQIAAFEFTSIPKSYAARTGRPDNIGVIGVALFRERAPVVAQLAAPAAESAQKSRSWEAEVRGSANASADRSASEMPTPASSLGTGHGRREQSVVTQVEFDREQTSPNEVIRIRYDSEANLLAMGVIRPAPRKPQPFPDEPQLGYVPDP